MLESAPCEVCPSFHVSVSVFLPSFQSCSLLNFRKVKCLKELWLAQWFSTWEAIGPPPEEKETVKYKYVWITCFWNIKSCEGKQELALDEKWPEWLFLRKLITKARVYSLKGQPRTWLLWSRAGMIYGLMYVHARGDRREARCISLR